VRADFGGEVNRGLAEEVGVVADLLGGSALGHCACRFDDGRLLRIDVYVKESVVTGR
jgi:hypothetical protein